MSQPLIDYTNKDYASLRAALLQLATERLPEWTDKSPNDLGVMLLELVAYLGDSLFYNQDRIAAESFLETAVERRSVLQHLRLIGYELKPPLAASADLTLLFKWPSSPGVTIVSVAQGTTFKTTAAVTGVPINFQYVQPTTITITLAALPYGIIDASGALAVRATLPAQLPAGSIAYLAYQTLPVSQIDKNVGSVNVPAQLPVNPEIVASSDGSPGQRHRIALAPILDDTLKVWVDEGGGLELWTLVPSLLNSSNTDTHYFVRRDENGVVFLNFGDGTFGKMPARGLNNIVAVYAVGGGAKGNVPPYAISKAVTSIQDLKLVANAPSADGRRSGAAGGGTDAETAASAVQRGPLLFRAMGRAVTESDYEVLAKTFGVGKAKAKARNWNNILLIVAPEGGGDVSDTLKQDLLAFLDTKRLMTSLVQIADPVYVAVLVDATVFVQPQFSKLLVQQAVMNAIANLLAFDNVEFGQPVYISKVYEVIQDLAGVDHVSITKFARKDAFDPSQPIPTSGTLDFVPENGELPIFAGFNVALKLPTPADATYATSSNLVMTSPAGA